MRTAIETPRRHARSGNAIIETTLLVPWIFFLFVGVLDFGFYAYAAISTQNAARVAVLGTAGSGGSADSQPLACLFAWSEMQRMPNSADMPADCSALPLIVQAESFPDPSDASGTALASRVTVTYQTIPMIPIPGVLMGQLTLTRVAEMKVFGD